MIKQFYADLPEGAVPLELGGVCPCTEGRVLSIDRGSRTFACSRGTHKLPNYTFHVVVEGPFRI